MAFDFKKEYKEFYMPKNTPEIVNVPVANYIAVRGKGNPNQEGGTYQQAVGILYAIAYTIKMSYKGLHKIEGFFEYVVPPLEGFWWQDNVKGVDYGNKDTFNWISVIRLPDFVTKNDFDWAVAEATKKKKLDCSSAEFLTVDEGLCVQIMHIGPFDDEPATVSIMDKYLNENDMNLSYVELVAGNFKQAAYVLSEHLQINNFKIIDDKVIRIYDVDTPTQELSKKLVQNDVAIESMNEKSESLEDYFLKMTTEGK